LTFATPWAFHDVGRILGFNMVSFENMTGEKSENDLQLEPHGIFGGNS
jgi:hypothetical protein